MSFDLLLGKTNRDWSCGKSSAELWDEAESQRLHPRLQMSQSKKSIAELWDEAESQRLHKPVHQMKPLHRKPPPLDGNQLPEPLSPPETPWGWIFSLGAVITTVAIVKNRKATVALEQRAKP